MNTATSTNWADDRKLWLPAFLVSIPVSIVGIGLKGLALVQLWQWFIVPFFDAPPLPIAYAVGISMFAALLTGVSYPDEPEPSLMKLFSVGIAKAVTVPVKALVIGWIVTWFIV